MSFGFAPSTRLRHSAVETADEKHGKERGAVNGRYGTMSWEGAVQPRSMLASNGESYISINTVVKISAAAPHSRRSEMSSTVALLTRVEIRRRLWSRLARP